MRAHRLGNVLSSFDIVFVKTLGLIVKSELALIVTYAAAAVIIMNVFVSSQVPYS